MKASIVIRAYNAENTIERAVRSALDQEFPSGEMEVVIVNDGSTDRTREILEPYRALPQVNVIDQANNGAIAAANRGFTASRGEYIVLLDSDDMFHPDLIRELSGVLDKHPEIHFVYPDYYEVNPVRGPRRRRGSRHRRLASNGVNNGKRTLISPQNMFETVAIGVMFRRAAFEEVGFYREGVGFAEYDLLLRTLGRWKGYHHPRPLFTYHRHQDSITADPVRVALLLAQLEDLHPDKRELIRTIRAYGLPAGRGF